MWPQAGFEAISVPDFFGVNACRMLPREQESMGWLHPATQADAELASIRISSPEVMELRRTIAF